MVKGMVDVKAMTMGMAATEKGGGCFHCNG